MKKIFLIGSILLSTLNADSTLGTIISNESNNPITKTIIKPNKVTPQPSHKPEKKIHKKKFKKDHHRYNKRYQNFNYDKDGYYNQEGYYYGYYDKNGYFYNNIFFTYNHQYTYQNRYYLRGFFRPQYQHHREYQHHHTNNWNRIHCYREENQVVYGHYYNRPSNRYRPYRSNYYNQNTPSFSHTRMYPSSRVSNTNRNINSRTHQRREIRNSTRMRTHSHRARHMQMSR